MRIGFDKIAQVKGVFRRIVSLVLLATAAAVQAQFAYTNNGDGTCTITNYTGSSRIVNIPSCIDGLLVTGIGNGSRVFYNYPPITNVTIPSSVVSIGANAFLWCTGLTSLTIPGTVTTIGAFAFELCDEMTGITISDGVTSIGDSAFGACNDLTNIAFPASVTNIGTDLFTACDSLTAITVDPANLYYSSMNGVLFNKNQTILMQFPMAIYGNYTIPNTVTNIQTGAFTQSLLNTVTIPGSVVSIDDYAFESSEVTGYFFGGNAPAADSAFFGLPRGPAGYYLPNTTGWSNFSISTGLPVVLWNPLIQPNALNFGVLSNQFGFNITGTSNIPIVVAACTNLANPAWMPLQFCSLTNGSITFTDPAWTNYSSRYYSIAFP